MTSETGKARRRKGPPVPDPARPHREHVKRLAAIHRQLAKSNPSDHTTAGRPDPTMPGYEFVGVPEFFIRRKII